MADTVTPPKYYLQRQNRDLVPLFLTSEAMSGREPSLPKQPQKIIMSICRPELQYLRADLSITTVISRTPAMDICPVSPSRKTCMSPATAPPASIPPPRRPDPSLSHPPSGAARPLPSRGAQVPTPKATSPATPSNAPRMAAAHGRRSTMARCSRRPMRWSSARSRSLTASGPTTARG